MFPNSSPTPPPSVSDYRQLTQQLFTTVKETEKLNRAVDVQTGKTSNNQTQPMTRSSINLGLISTSNSGRKSSKGKKEKECAEEWVQCDTCSRWRLLPPPSDPLYPKELPDKWICTMNTWNPAQALCRFTRLGSFILNLFSVPEESSTNHSEATAQRAMKLRYFFHVLCLSLIIFSEFGFVGYAPPIVMR